MIFSRVRIKMCGMTRVKDIEHAHALGVDAVGLIFYAKSPRALSIEQATSLTRNLPAFLNVIAVFVNPDKDLVDNVMNKIPVQALQFHGQEPADFCALFNKPFIKAIPALSRDMILNAQSQYEQAAAILLDTPSSEHGGTGRNFNWDIIPKAFDKPLILAGGLNPGNIREAVSTCSPYAVDVCSGIEKSPGIKDHGKMNELVNALWGRA
ncbi:phosphoribosylanthranilate isomerase [Legionella jordanis]|uniref:N-(5'-phosphoribosyl)anthranilate isomerase n=2 Tax=Legionella jordanis TaxID=456 RepID=A0A0W0V7V2_9GAMM|nr:phosphoribosylanthranilate isomerase [Legionella jordanis]KTD16203.1 N-(5'-phosphoribosyl)anthranilate isomerase [Legionella jordanis]RMX04576.1 phosphoribosylanthranilate isomerase [Legionella jordanis]VEH12339.1 phosphoribosyl anthranilate isomerase [Legionella jordanis]HAT8713546.1 phosphoribosylanthranilate isomerase [Legionella jordanis]